MNLPGYLTEDGDGFECASCGDKIEQGQDCLRVDRAKVEKNSIGEPHVQSHGYAAVFHRDCL